ncbi:PPIase cyclophilin-type domain-containing protein [Plasmodiophora brassicae]
MSSVYALEPATLGKVVLHTSVGDLDVELWPKQAPRACRNFVQLCMEGYYDRTIFHRVVKGFMAQGGDPTGTGHGGESIYGAPFRMETHSRLRFSHRGVVAMATPPDQPDGNGSQFFMTFDACEWLNGKHTIFGKITGDTIFNLLKMQDLDVDESERPEHPPIITGVDVLLSPFDDIVPRDKRVREEPTKKVKKKKQKNTTLLSFDEDNADNIASARMVSSHDVIDDATPLKPTANIDNASEPGPERSARKPPVSEPAGELEKLAETQGRGSIVARAASSVKSDLPPDKESELAELRKKVASLKSRAFHVSKQSTTDQAPSASLLSPLEQRRQMYLSRKTASRKQREKETLAKLSKFQQALQTDKTEDKVKASASTVNEDEGDDESGWMRHSLAFNKRPQDFDPMARDVTSYEYVLTDPLGEFQHDAKKRRVAQSAKQK